MYDVLLMLSMALTALKWTALGEEPMAAVANAPAAAVAVAVAAAAAQGPSTVVEGLHPWHDRRDCRLSDRSHGHWSCLPKLVPW